jgi:DNA-binding XRE family transcriptional regulator
MVCIESRVLCIVVSARNTAMAGSNIKLRRLRIEKHWTLRIAAQHMGVSTTTLFNAEQGVMPRVDHAIKIAVTYNRSVEELWTPDSATQSALAVVSGVPLGAPPARVDYFLATREKANCRPAKSTNRSRAPIPGNNSPS